MRIVLVLKPYAIEIYTREQDVYTHMHTEQSTRIEDESLSDYEKRVIFICKKICTEIRSSTYYKNVVHSIKGIDIVLASPWCRYDVMHVEKDFGKKTTITDAAIQSLFVKKDQEDLYVVESCMSHILLNGYPVDYIQGQSAQTIECEYVHIYAQKTFITSLLKTVESIFHTHTIHLTSIYGLVEFVSKHRANSTNRQASQMEIIIEDEHMNISYMHNGLYIAHVSMPYSYFHLEHDIASKLITTNGVVREILTSRTQCLEQNAVQEGAQYVTPQIDKNAKKLWPDLDESVKQTIQQALDEHVEKVLGYVRNYIDTIDSEYIKNTTTIYVYGISPYIISAYGIELAKKIVEDPYISMRMPVSLQKDSIASIF